MQLIVINHKQQGVTLIESMIALLVISIGLLGIASLQVTSIQQNGSALQHSQAVWAANNMADRIRANIDEFDTYSGKKTTTGFTEECITKTCSVADMVLADMADWEKMVENLPAGQGEITSPTPDELLVKVMWDDEGADPTPTGTGCTASASDLTCYTVSIIR